ncbi:MAG TPA: MerR family transcriptional regulator [Rhodanobacteraceae bacterium]
MAQTTERLTIGRLAKAAGVNVETVRYYQRRGLLRNPPRPLGGVRSYTGQDVARLAFIKASQRLGFTLEQTGQLLHLDAGMQCEAAATLASVHLVDVRARLHDLTRIEAALSELLERCEHRAGKVACPLILALRAGANGQDHP